MFSTANINLLGVLTSIEKSTTDLIKNVQHQFAKHSHESPLASNTFHNNSIRVPLHRIRADPLSEVCSYLTPPELCALKAVSKFTHEVISKNSRSYWKEYCNRTYGSKDLINEASFHQRYLELRIKDLESQYANLNAARRQRVGIDAYRQRGGQGMIGVVSDLAWVEDEEIAKTISRKRFMAMATLVCTQEGVITRFKEAIKNMPLACAMSFMPHRTAVNATNGTSHIAMLKKDIIAPGSLGYAVNLIKLRPQHEYMRYSVFWIIFRNLMIFDTYAHALDYDATLDGTEAENFWAVSIDQYSHEIDNVYPRLLTRPSYTYENPKDTNYLLASLQDEIQRTKYSYTVLRYS